MDHQLPDKKQRMAVEYSLKTVSDHDSGSDSAIRKGAIPITPSVLTSRGVFNLVDTPGTNTSDVQ